MARRGAHNPRGKGGGAVAVAAAAAAAGSGRGRVGSGSGSIGGVGRSYFTLSVCRPQCSARTARARTLQGGEGRASKEKKNSTCLLRSRPAAVHARTCRGALLVEREAGAEVDVLAGPSAASIGRCYPPVGLCDGALGEALLRQGRGEPRGKGRARRRRRPGRRPGRETRRQRRPGRQGRGRWAEPQ